MNQLSSMTLDPVASAAGVGLVTFAEIGSTNSEACARARVGLPAAVWIVAEQQTAGRGRRGNVWVSEPGNVYASLLQPDPAPRAHITELSFVAALAVHDTISAVAPQLAARVSLKWPNDVLIDGAKVAGILIEGEGAAAIIGIGINCRTHPQATPYPCTDLAELGAAAAAADVFTALTGAMQRRIVQWERGANFGAIREDWLTRAVGVGSAVRVRLPDREIDGHFDGLDEAGRLILRRDDETVEMITAGDVFPLGVPAQTDNSL